MTFWQNMVLVLVGGSSMAITLRVTLSRLLTFSLAHPIQTQALARAILDLALSSPAATGPAPTDSSLPPAA